MMAWAADELVMVDILLLPYTPGPLVTQWQQHVDPSTGLVAGAPGMVLLVLIGQALYQLNASLLRPFYQVPSSRSIDI